MNTYSKDCELVLALVCPVGINLEDIQSRLSSIFEQFNYTANWIHISKLVKKIGDSEVSQSHGEADRLDKAMKEGTELREKYNRGDMLALLAIKEINKLRPFPGDRPSPLKRHVHIIRSLKHADEVETLRQAYGAGFFLLGISATLESRKHYLKQLKGVPDHKIERLIERDDKEAKPLGQQTRDVFELADAYVTTDDEARLSNQLANIVDILFSKPVAPPTIEEYAMFMAYAASLRSADLARQVGAVIVNERGDIVSTGANDVPKFKGGLYWSDEDGGRDYVRGYDSNEKEKEIIIEDAARKILGDKADQASINNAIEKLKDSKLMNITEYGRAVHAEMEALLQAARNGTAISGCTLYTTTYPCHNCAKHIVAAGITKVIYVEPYPKSYAMSLHQDTISDDGSPQDGKVIFQQFIGIGPRRFIDLFSMNLSSGRRLKRKKHGKALTFSRRNTELRVPMSPLSYLDIEVLLIKELESVIHCQPVKAGEEL